MRQALQIVWFKRDLRVYDHAPLAAAHAHGPVLPLYIVEPALWAEPDLSARQWRFVRQSLSELQEDLAALGQPLVVMVGDAVSIFAELHVRHGIGAIWSHEETGNGWTYARDRAIGQWAQQAGVPWHEIAQFGVVRRLKSRNGWAKIWDAAMLKPLIATPPALTPLGRAWPTRIPTEQDLDLLHDPCPFQQKGGRSAGLSALDSFLYRRGRNYRFQMSSPLTAFHACSRLSAHITWGTLSLKEITQAGLARLEHFQEKWLPVFRPEMRGDKGSEHFQEKWLPVLRPQMRRNGAVDDRDDMADPAWQASLISFMGRLHWHCHFIQKLEDEPRLEFENLHPAYNGLRDGAANGARLAAWSEGRTGYPFVDACMRALNEHGWLNFRMRAMLMSFASYQLWLPWRETGLCLARKFVDYEPGIHWSQVQMQSGTTGINQIRIYNPVKQGMDHDPNGAFIRRYVPELKAVPDVFLHEPWLWPGMEHRIYPAPVVDHLASAKSARETLYAMRKTVQFQQQAAAIVEKHSSRKAGIPMTGRKVKASKAQQKLKDKPQDQLLLDL